MVAPSIVDGMTTCFIDDDKIAPRCDKNEYPKIEKSSCFCKIASNIPQ